MASGAAAPRHVLGVPADLFTQVSEDGRRLTLFQKGVPVIVGSHAWEDAGPEG